MPGRLFARSAQMAFVASKSVVRAMSKFTRPDAEATLACLINMYNQ
jgi:hypothetical protein